MTSLSPPFVLDPHELAAPGFRGGWGFSAFTTYNARRRVFRGKIFTVGVGGDGGGEGEIGWSRSEIARGRGGFGGFSTVDWGVWGVW